MGAENITAYGAVGNNPVQDTIGFRAAYAASVAGGGGGRVYVPGGGRFEVTDLNATMNDSVEIFGDGDRSVLVVAGADAKGHWIDTTGSSDVTFRNIKVVDKPGVIPTVLFFCSAAQANGGTVNGIRFDKVNVEAKSLCEHLYAYGVAYNNGRYAGAGGLVIRDSNFVQKYNGAPQSLSYARSAAARFDGINSRGFQSAYTPVSLAQPGNTGVLLDNANFIDAAPGCGNGVNSNNASAVFVTTGLLVMNGGSFQSYGISNAIFYINNEGLTFNNPVFKATDGSGNTCFDWMLFGGGENSNFVMNSPFFSSPRRTFLGFDEPWGGLGGLKNSVIQAPDVGDNPNNCYFTLTTFPAITPYGVWLRNIDFQLLNGANNIQSCGDITGVLRNAGSVVVPAGAYDYSRKL